MSDISHRIFRPTGLTNLFSCDWSDYAVVIVGGVFVFAGGWWIISARKWFHGPVITVESHSALTPHSSSESGMASEK